MLARSIDLPVATAHRQVATLIAEGYLLPLAYGRHIAGPRLRALLTQVDDNKILAHIAAPLLHRLAAKAGVVAQLGTYENEMVTYRVKTGQGADTLLTQIDMQLEAYCTAIGKVLLAHLPQAERDAYLAGGPFVALTPNTITDPAQLALELQTVAWQGFAEDRGEIDPALFCLAVPINFPDGSVPAAISISRLDQGSRFYHPALLGTLIETAHEIKRACAKIGYPTRYSNPRGDFQT